MPISDDIQKEQVNSSVISEKIKARIHFLQKYLAAVFDASQKNTIVNLINMLNESKFLRQLHNYYAPVSNNRIQRSDPQQISILKWVVNDGLYQMLDNEKMVNICAQFLTDDKINVENCEIFNLPRKTVHYSYNDRRKTVATADDTNANKFQAVCKRYTSLKRQDTHEKLGSQKNHNDERSKSEDENTIVINSGSTDIKNSTQDGELFLEKLSSAISSAIQSYLQTNTGSLLSFFSGHGERGRKRASFYQTIFSAGNNEVSGDMKISALIALLLSPDGKGLQECVINGLNNGGNYTTVLSRVNGHQEKCKTLARIFKAEYLNSMEDRVIYQSVEPIMACANGFHSTPKGENKTRIETAACKSARDNFIINKNFDVVLTVGKPATPVNNMH